MEARRKKENLFRRKSQILKSVTKPPLFNCPQTSPMMWGFIYNVVEIYPDFLPLECAIPYAPCFFFTILLFFKRQSQNNKIKSSLLEEMIFGQSRLL